MKTILVPVDFSANSRQAMDYAIFLAEKLNMKLLLFHSFHPALKEAVMDTYRLLVDEPITGTPNDIRDGLKAWKQALKLSNPSIHAGTLFMEGDLSGNILEVIEEHKISLIVMGTLGASGIKQVLIGSNTMQVIEKATCPVFAVPAGYAQSGIRKMMFATNYRQGDEICIHSLGAMAKQLDAEFAIVHIIDSQLQPGEYECLSENYVAAVAKDLHYELLKFHCLKGSDTLLALNGFIQDERIDLVAVSFQDRSLISSLFSRGLVRKLAFHSKIPLLVWPYIPEQEPDLRQTKRPAFLDS